METTASSPTYPRPAQTKSGHAADAHRSPRALLCPRESHIPSTMQAAESPPDALLQTPSPDSPEPRGSPAVCSAAKPPIPTDSPGSCCESKRPHPLPEAPLPGHPPSPAAAGSSNESKAPPVDSLQARALSCFSHSCRNRIRARPPVSPAPCARLVRHREWPLQAPPHSHRSARWPPPPAATCETPLRGQLPPLIREHPWLKST